MYPALHQELVHPCVRSWFDMPLVSSINGTPMPFPTEGSAAKRLHPPSRASWRGPAQMSEAKKLKFEGNRIEFALAFLKSRHPLKTADCVAGETGISAKTISQWLCGNSKPGWHHTLALIGAYGPEFLAAVCPRSRIWIEPARKLEELRHLELERVRLNQRIKELSGNAHAGVGGSGQAAGGVPGGLVGEVARSSIGLDGNGRLADDSSDDGGGS
jgi:hypothetical protein